MTGAMGRNKQLALLYVEDEPEIREMMEKVLSWQYPDLSLYVASDGAKGLGLFLEHRQELVLTDFNMPVMTGIQMAQQIMAIDSETVIIAVTAYNSDSFISTAMENGFSSYISKPINFGDLCRAIDEGISRISEKMDAG